MSILFKILELLYKLFGEKFLAKLWKLVKKEFRHTPLVFTLLTILVIASVCVGVVLAKYSNIAFNKGGSQQLEQAIANSAAHDRMTKGLTEAILRSNCSAHNFHGLILFKPITASTSHKTDPLEYLSYLFYFASLRDYEGRDIRFDNEIRQNTYLTAGTIGSDSSDVALIREWQVNYKNNEYMTKTKAQLLGNNIKAFQKFINRDGVNLCQFYVKPIFEDADHLRLRYVLTLSAECKEPCEPPYCQAYPLQPLCSLESLFNAEQSVVEEYLGAE